MAFRLGLFVQFPASDGLQFLTQKGDREGEREGGREGGRERKGGRGRKGGREGEREGGREEPGTPTPQMSYKSWRLKNIAIDREDQTKGGHFELLILKNREQQSKIKCPSERLQRSTVGCCL